MDQIEIKVLLVIVCLLQLTLITSAVSPTLHISATIAERPPYYFAEKTNSKKFSPKFDCKSDHNITKTDTRYVGMSPLIIDWLSRRMNFTYTITIFGEDVGYPVQINGTTKWTGATGRLANNEFDLIVTPMQISSKRAMVMDFFGYDVDLSAMVTPAPIERSPILSTIRPFTLTVWLLTALSLVAVAACLSLTTVCHPGTLNLKHKVRFDDNLFYLLAILINQGEIFMKKTRFRLPFRLATAGWCLLCVVLLNIYSGTLVSHITSREMIPTPQNTGKLFNDGVLSYLLVPSGLGLELIAENAMDPKMKRLGDLVRQHPETVVPTSDIAFDKVLSGCCAYYDTISYLEFRALQDFLTNGTCRVSIGKPVSGYALVGMGIAKSHPQKNVINHKYLELKQSGLIDYWRITFTGGHFQCYRWFLLKNKKMDKLRSLTLIDLGSALMILGVGYIISFIAFLVEQFKYCAICK